MTDSIEVGDDTSWDIAAAIEHSAEVDKVRDMIRATRAGMSENDRELPGLVCREVHRRHAAAILADQETARCLMSWAILHLCEEEGG